MSDVNSQKRQIKSKLRQRQAQATAQMIVEAAKALFLERGYASTTIEAIAERAEVAASTVYAVFGSKRAILQAIRAAWHEQTQIRQVTLSEPGDLKPEEWLDQLAAGTRRQWEFGADVVAIYQGAAAADSEAAAELKEALTGRRKALEHYASTLAPYLRPEVDVDRAAAIIQALCLAEVYYQLVRVSGWPAEVYQDWLAEALKRELL
jgi:AcrR family transcriptional regulator